MYVIPQVTYTCCGIARHNRDPVVSLLYTHCPLTLFSIFLLYSPLIRSFSRLLGLVIAQSIFNHNSFSSQVRLSFFQVKCILLVKGMQVKRVVFFKRKSSVKKLLSYTNVISEGFDIAGQQMYFCHRSHIHNRCPARILTHRPSIASSASRSL